MFKFGFEIDDADVDDELDFIVSGAKPHPTSSETIPDQKPCQELSLNDLVSRLFIAYTPSAYPDTQHSCTLFRPLYRIHLYSCL